MSEPRNTFDIYESRIDWPALPPAKAPTFGNFIKKFFPSIIITTTMGLLFIGAAVFYYSFFESEPRLMTHALHIPGLGLPFLFCVVFPIIVLVAVGLFVGMGMPVKWYRDFRG